LKKEYLKRLILGLGTALSVKNKIQAIGSLAIPEHRYNFEIIDWRQEELQKTGQKNEETAHPWTPSP
jgi:D-mannonate dehydratase